MSKQIAVRLPDDMVAFIDEQIASDRAPSRAAVVLRALEGERRRLAAMRDIAILTGPAVEVDPDDFQALADYAAELPSDLG